MPKIISLLTLIFSIISCKSTITSAPINNAPATEKPTAVNILVIIADDLGFTDLGAFGSEIETPNIDALAQAGMMLTNFHTAPTCSPTRSMLLSGTDNHLAGLGVMEEFLRLGDAFDDAPGYEGHINDRVVTITELLKDAGYRTYIAGKWHLGLEEDSSPKARGFDRSFVMLDGGAGHFDDLGIMPDQPKAKFRENGQLTTIPSDFYSSQFYAEKMMSYLDRDKNSDTPFFAYLSFTAPHWPLQAPAASIAKYQDRYNEGYEVLFEQRLQRQKELGLVDNDITGPPLLKNQKKWQSLSEDEKKRSSKKMAIYAAMIDDLDHYLGKVIQKLKDIGAYDNTYILFMSDNGAQGGTGFPGLEEFIKKCCDNSYANMGKANSYLFTGPNWARASTGQSRLYKGSTTEGGIRAPAILVYPNALETGVKTNQFLSVLDIMPTIFEIANIEHPGNSYHGKPIYPPKGTSIAPLFKSSTNTIHKDDYVMGWEQFGHRAIRQGDYKLVQTPPPLGDGKWGLYDLANDPSEQSDLSVIEPTVFASMLKLWHQYEADNGVVDFFKATKTIHEIDSPPSAHTKAPTI
jgi:arylsulfatase